MLSQSPSKKILSKAVLWYSSKKLFIKQYSKEEELFHKKLHGNQISRLFEIVWKIGKVTMNKNKVPI